MTLIIQIPCLEEEEALGDSPSARLCRERAPWWAATRRRPWTVPHVRV